MRLSIADLLIDAVGDTIEPDKVELVVATKIHREDLRCYIRRNSLESPASTDEQNYQRLKRQRSRTLARLRESCVSSSLLTLTSQRPDSEDI